MTRVYDDDEPVDLAAVLADDEMIEAVLRDQRPLSDDEAVALLRAWRAGLIGQEEAVMIEPVRRPVLWGRLVRLFRRGGDRG